MAHNLAQQIYIDRIAPFDKERTLIQWNISKELRAVGDLVFTLELSGSPMGPWEEVATNLVDTLFYEHTEPKTFGALKDKYYRVSILGTKIVSVPMTILGHMRQQQFLIARKIHNDEKIMLKKGSGIRLAVIKKKHWGTPCCCVDPITRQSINSKCELCNGTKYIDGYYTPILTYGHIQPSTLNTDYGSNTSIPEIQTSQAMLQSFPLVYKDDVIVELDTNTRWIVISSKNTEILRNPVHQDILVSRLSVSDSAFNVDVSSCYHQNIS